MSNWMMVLALLTFVFAQTDEAQTTAKGETKAVCALKITGMTCGGCEAAVKIAARRIDGVTAVTASYTTGTADVTYDPARTSPDAIAKEISRKSGFKAEVVNKK